ncbi:MAG: transposase [Halioglobus sp.]|jgi:transposase
MKIFGKPQRKREEEADLRTEIAVLKRKLKRTESERAILKEAAVFFASESKNATRS